MIEQWFSVHRGSGESRLRLFAFPHGGGGAGAFRSWPARIPAHVELWAFAPPGREQRYREPSLPTMAAIVDAFMSVAAAQLALPYALFGHSLGALVAFEVAQRIRQSGMRDPELLIASGHSAPHVPLRRRPIHQLADRDMVNAIKEFSGTPAKILEDPDMMALMLPPLRNDFRIRETYRCGSAEPLSCRVVALAGDSDPEVMPQELEAWGKHTRGAFSWQMLPGSHFFLNEARSNFFSRLTRELGLIEQCEAAGREGAQAQADMAARVDSAVPQGFAEGL